MKIVVTGGRRYGNKERVFQVLDRLHAHTPIELVAHGGAWGADRHAAQWASQNHIAERSYPAQWDKYGPSAGPRRNKEMLEQVRPDMVVAFPGGRGTESTINYAKSMHITVLAVSETSR